MTRVHLVACGNDMCGDDGAGAALLRSLEELDLGPDVLFTNAGLGVASWRRVLDPGETVVFLDAAAGPGAPGTVSLERFGPQFERLIDDGRIEHGLHPLRLFALERELYPGALPQEAWLCLIAAATDGDGPARAMGTGLSPEVTEGVEVARKLLVRRFFK